MPTPHSGWGASPDVGSVRKHHSASLGVGLEAEQWLRDGESQPLSDRHEQPEHRK
jgi:hypothetical protein